MIRVEYGTAQMGVKELFTPTAENILNISKVDDLTKNISSFKNFGNPCEPYSVLLDGSTIAIPENTGAENIGVWSQVLSNENGGLAPTLPYVEFTSTEVASTEGITLTFDVQKNIYATEFDAEWYLEGVKVKSATYNPTTPIFFAFEKIDAFDKLLLIFKAINTPYSRFKLRGFEFGVFFQVRGQQVKSVSVSQKIDPISTTLPISSSNLVLLNVEGAELTFANRQNMRIYDNDTLIGDFFIENAKKTNKQQWSVSATDYIALLDGVDFPGGIYVNKNAHELLHEIFDTANIPYDLAESLKDKTLTGYISYTTCRKALQQVLIGIGAFANTSYSSMVKIEETANDVVEEITLDRVMVGQKVDVDTDVTSVEVVAHAYAPVEDVVTLFQAEAEQTELKVIFNQPVHDLSIENGEIVENGTNYAVISCSQNGVLKGKKYDHLTFSKIKANATSKSLTAKRKTIKEATLVSAENLDNVLDICYNYIIKNKSAKSKIIEQGQPLWLGKTYSVDTETEGKITGILTEQAFNLFGGKVVKNTVIR